MQAPQQLHEGMKVRSADGETLGKLIARGDDGFTIEKGLFFPKAYVAGYEEISEIRDDEVWLRQTRDEIQRGDSPRAEMATDPPSAGNQRVTSTAAGTQEEVRIPLVEEELEVEKRTKEAGEVRIHKDVTTVEKNITVPVTREEVRVERVPASGDAAGASFREGETRVPVREEEIEIHKRPVVREEVRVTKTAVEEQQQVQERTRKEEAEIEQRGEVKRRS
jgi:uncharacterized protein (TIGR02271 family)